MKKKGERSIGFDASVATHAKKAGVFTLLITLVLVTVLMIWEALFGAPMIPFMHSEYGMRSMPPQHISWAPTPGEVAYDDVGPLFDDRFPLDYPPPPSIPTVSNNLERKIIKTGSLSLFVGDVEKTTDAIRGVAERLGGFVGSSRVYEVSKDVKAANITLRVPADRFTTAIADIKKLAVTVDQESIDAHDTTDSIVGAETNLQRLRAEEEQYLDMMANAATLQEKLEVTGYLADVRGQIEAWEAQLISSRNQVDMSAISVSLTAEADVEVLGIRWKPLFVVKQALRNMLADFTDYANNMIYFVFKLPILIAWLATIAVIGLILWNILLWIKNQIL